VIRALFVIVLLVCLRLDDNLSSAEAPPLFGAGYTKVFARPFTAGASLAIRRHSWSRNIYLTFFVRDASRGVIRVTGSQRDLGNIALRTHGRVYLYFPSAELLLTLPAGVGAQPLFGSDFSADDLLAFGDVTGRFAPASESAETLSGTAARRFELKPRDAKNAPYAAARLWIARDGGMPLRQEFYSADGALIREVVAESGGRMPFPVRWWARTFGPRGGESELRFTSYEANRQLADDLFTVEGIRRWR